MRGHEPILAMRKKGVAPKIIFINDFLSKTELDWRNPGEKYGEVWRPDHATVSTDGDAMSSLDLRFLVGLMVSITSQNEGRAKALFEKAKAAGAKTVAACHVITTNPNGFQSGWTEIYHSTKDSHA